MFSLASGIICRRRDEEEEEVGDCGHDGGCNQHRESDQHSLDYEALVSVVVGGYLHTY